MGDAAVDANSSDSSAKQKLVENAQSKIGYRGLITEAILGYQFWSLFCAIAPLIWFYPLNELELSGYEAFAIVLFSPALLGAPPLRRAVIGGGRAWPLAAFRLVALASLASFRAAGTLPRLVALCAGCFAVMIVLTATLWSRSPRQRTLTCWGLLLGLFTLLSARVWFVSFLPTWWDVRSNSVVIALTAAATFDKIFSGEDGAPPVIVSPVPRPNWVISGLGFGSLLYVTQLLFTELSVVARWTVKGYPDAGPSPYPWGIVILLALWLGISLSPCRHVTDSAIWWLIGVVSLAGLYYLDTWWAFAGGAVFAVYVASIWPSVIDRVTVCPPARTVVLAAAVFLVQILFSVWTVAYNFVPGGVYTRERTDVLLIAVAACLGLTVLTGRKTEKHKSFTAFVEIGGEKMPIGKVEKLFFLLVLVGLGGFASRYNAQTFTHPPKEQPTADFTAAIWTYHFGYDNIGWPSLERSAQLLNDSGADVITLLESDASKPFLGNNDLGMWLGERLGMYVDFGVSTRDHTWGNLILSKYPIVRSVHHMLPSPHGELAPAITATVNMTGHLVDFVVTHMGNDGDVLDRQLQAKFLAKELRNAENPVVFLGYVTSAPDSRDYNELVTRGGVKDIDASDKDRWCEYIFYRGLIRLGYARVSHGGLSDTELQLARFRFPPAGGAAYRDNDEVVKAKDSRVDRRTRFTKRFGSFNRGHNWIEKHRYHMATPKYFV